ncbi:chitobiase/beta-hexosaminidase C-terminal domain-containing protein [Neobacillus cucumis]|uniref:chitobiase/beta-hexosaminidase C-terminal domain-containing protein n=1 Tax=Neobacillus cucumis TaxID=1740721 RepID=UPI002041850F|nr:chitobiase/beta-hexosaminidase C-terminal domain-containing protein [Neobacillus cucumis]MCM3725791.1 chitobiase/beta-hexosaminidase C-terminal domain-containing protein [Neobacillus cucumis]
MKNRRLRKLIGLLMLALLIFPSYTITAFAKDTDNRGKVAAPTPSLPPGEYYKSQTIELGSVTPGVSIYYTLDGSIPTKQSLLYTEPITISQNTVIKAIAIRGNVNSSVLEVTNGKTNSEVVDLTYTFVTRESIADKFLKLTYNSMPYRLYVPENYDPNKSYPLVLFLHGGGERGTDNVKQITANDGAVIWAAPENQAKHQAFVLAPQARNVPDGGFGITRDSDNNINLSRVFEFSTDLGTAYEILQHVRNNYNIDSNRLYSTGLSQGGFGTYNLNMKYPDLFAAMVPIAGGGDPEKAYLLGNKPIWEFHAVDDSVIPVSYSQNIIEAIRNAGGNPIYTEYPAEFKYNHGSWVPAYENKEMIEWVFKQEKLANVR